MLYSQVFRVTFDPAAEQPRQTGFDDIGDEKIISDYLKYPDDAAKRAAAWQLLDQPEARRRLGILRQASMRPQCQFPVHWQDGFGALFPQLEAFRQAARWVLADAQILATQGHSDEALEWVQVALRMSRHAAMSTPTLIGDLVSQAILGIAFTQAEGILSARTPSAQALTQTLHTASEIDPYAAFRHAMMGERVFGIMAFGLPAQWLAGALDALGWPPPASGITRGYTSALMAPLRRYDEASYLRIMAQRVALAGTPVREVTQAAWLSAGEAAVDRAGRRGAMLTLLLVPALDRSAAKRDGTAMRLGSSRSRWS